MGTWRMRRNWRVSRRTRVPIAAMVAVVSTLVGCSQTPSSHASPLPLKPVGEVALPGDGSRFDYASLDSERGLLFIAHLGASEVIEVDVHANRVVRTIPNLAQVHGVLVVPELHRVYATATGDNHMAVVDEDTGAVLNRAPTGQYPDGLAYDPKRNAVWTTNETGGTETVIEAGTAAVRGSVDSAARSATSSTTRPPTGCWWRCRVAAISRSSTLRPLPFQRGSACRAAITRTDLPSTRRPGRRSWPVTATPPLSRWMWPAAGSRAAARWVTARMCWPTTRARTASTSPQKAAWSASCCATNAEGSLRVGEVS